MHTSSGPRRKSTVLASLPLVLAAALASAQNDDAPVFRTSTRLVQLNVVVLDQQNHPANGLGLGDFHVFDNGVEQKLAHFSPGEDSSPASPVSPSPLLVTNRQGANDQPQAVTAILIDEFLLDSPRVVPAELTAPIRSARLAVLSYLASMPPGQQIALYAMRRDGIVVIHDFTSNSASLVAAAKTLGAGGVRGKSINLPGLRPEGARALRGWKENGRAGLRSRNLVPNDDFGSLLTAGIAAIVKHLEAVPGRKNLVWISSTLPETVSGLDMPTMLNGAGANITATPSLANPTPSPVHPSPQGFYDSLRDFARWLSDSNIAVYPIDANGLTISGSSLAQWSAADMIASESGGRAIFDSNGIDQQLRRITTEASSFYQIGYQPGESAWDGKYHKIRVRLSPGHEALSVHCRRGYFAKDPAVTPDSDGALLQAATSVVESPAVGLSLQVPSNPLPAGPQNVLLKVDLRDIQFDFTGPQAKADLDVAFVQLGKEGRIIGQFKDRVNLAFEQQTYLNFAAQGWFYSRKVSIPPEAEKLRVLVRDLATGAVGSVSVLVAFHKKTK